jgi:hypothetical protein
MDTQIKWEFDAVLGTGEMVPLTDQDLINKQILTNAEIKKQTDFDAKEAAKAAAEAKLAVLGLTTDDLKALGL